jgi:thioester reductase-like protein/putative sterol carrier protein
MRDSGYILLTGATGFLGRYVLRDLLARGRRVAVLVRDGRSSPAAERIAELLSSGHDRPANPVVLTGDLCAPHLGLSLADRAWLGRHGTAVLHVAAEVSLRRSLHADPWRTNVEGTQHVLDLCTALCIGELHHVSTAFVCGERLGPVREDELHCGQIFHNDYEKSKFEAERRVRANRRVFSTIYRPSVIVGDSRTGFTSSYHGFYRFLELGTRLAGPGTERRVLPLRLPFTGDERRNLVPVDWVARAIAGIVNRPRWHGLTYHLVADVPTPVRDIKEVAEEVLAIDGVRWAEPCSPTPPAPLEEMFLDQLREYWPYFHDDPLFDDRNTRAVLPHLPAPPIDRAMLARLIRFAAADRWGRASRKALRSEPAFSCRRYVEEVFPESVRRSSLARIALDVTLGLDVRGANGGQWSCRLCDGTATVRRDLSPEAEVVYQMDQATFEAVASGRCSPQDAFLARDIEIKGDVEKGLKLATLFNHLVKESSLVPKPRAEDMDAVAGRA